LSIVKEIADLHQVKLTLLRGIRAGARFDMQFKAIDS